MSSRVRGALLWSFSERYASLIITVASTMALARLLTPTQIGIYSVCAAFVAVATVLRDFGISEYIIQEKELTEDKLRATYAAAIIIGWSMGLLAYSVRHPLAAYLNEPAVVDVIAILTLNFLILPFASPAFALLNRHLAFRKIFALHLSSAVVHACTGVFLAWKGFGHLSLAWATVANTGFQALMLLFMRPPGTLLWPGFKGLRGVFTYGSMFATSRLVEVLTRNAHEFLIARLFSLTAVGLFSRALSLLEMFYNNVTEAVLRVASPAFADSHRNGQDMGLIYARGTAMLTVVAWPFFGYIALMAPDIVRLLFGHQWDAAAPICSVLAVATMPFYLYNLGPNLLSATGHVAKRLRISLIYCGVHLATLPLAGQFGLEAIAATWFISHMLALVLYAYAIRKLLNTRLSVLFGPSVSSLTVAAGSIACQAAMAALCHRYQLPLLVDLLLVAAAGALSWLAGARLTHHLILPELMRLLSHMRRKNPA